MPGPETASPSSPAPATPPPGPDTASEVVRWAAFSCVLVPVVLVGFGTSLAGAAGTALGLAAVTGACRVLLRQSERVAARLHAEEPPPPGPGTAGPAAATAPRTTITAAPGVAAGVAPKRPAGRGTPAPRIAATGAAEKRAATRGEAAHGTAATGEAARGTAVTGPTVRRPTPRGPPPTPGARPDKTNTRET